MNLLSLNDLTLVGCTFYISKLSKGSYIILWQLIVVSFLPSLALSPHGLYAQTSIARPMATHHTLPHASFTWYQRRSRAKGKP